MQAIGEEPAALAVCVRAYSHIPRINYIHGRPLTVPDTAEERYMETKRTAEGLGGRQPRAQRCMLTCKQLRADTECWWKRGPN